ncbi:NAD(P)-dependent alcohol dehydrogenase [Streptomyces sp. DSM 15324]|uniref:NAD(P)-dependent alcohol dehydrogenase n=1 Tax=Streptomyces sp. DSM 15324 TaxID=1739111 RepID=UPI00074B1D99|nr:NAD(P)-dependent alcohol dehydrogenase [Streptomyces sp. DSM 15324]KUO14087.1 NADPH:quinone reductase [Streptomyces sp. DSM 15324]
MKAIVQERFGTPDVLRLAETDRPEAGPGQVVVRVRAAALNPYDWHMLRGDPYVARLMGGVGLTRPKERVAGIDAAGEVAAVGAGVSGPRPGDAVLGFCPGAFAEYARTTPDLVVPKPAGLTFEQAAAVPMAAVTALRGIRTVGRVRAGQRVLVNGAAGGVGTFAVQIAAALDAEVTAVCSARNAGLVRSLGAAHVVDHAREDFTERRGHYDVILDNVGNHPPGRLRRALAPTGTLVANAGGSPGRVFGAVGALLRVAAVDVVVRQRLRPVLPSAPAGPVHEDLLAVTALIEAGALAPVVDRTYALADTAEGLRHVERGHARGKAVIRVAGPAG